MKYGVTVPNFGDYFDPRTLAEVAKEAEAAGWDGFFLWDHVQFIPIADGRSVDCAGRDRTGY